MAKRERLSGRRPAAVRAATGLVVIAMAGAWLLGAMDVQSAAQNLNFRIQQAPQGENTRPPSDAVTKPERKTSNSRERKPVRPVSEDVLPPAPRPSRKAETKAAPKAAPAPPPPIVRQSIVPEQPAPEQIVPPPTVRQVIQDDAEAQPQPGPVRRDVQATPEPRPVLRAVPLDEAEDGKTGPKLDDGTTVAPETDSETAEEADQPDGPIKVTIVLPPLLRDLELTDEMFGLSALIDETQVVACQRVSIDPALATGVFECERSPIRKYQISLSGFESEKILDNDGRAGDPVFEWAQENMVALTSVVLTPATLDASGEGSDPVPIGVNWSKLLAGNASGFLGAMFARLDPASAPAGQICNLMEPEALDAATLVSGGAEPVELRLDCDFVRIDYEGMPAPASQFRPSQCDPAGGEGSICVLREAIATDAGPAVRVPASGIWGEAIIVIEPGMRLADHVAFSEDFAFRDGTYSVALGDRRLAYRVEWAMANSGPKAECSGKWQADDADGGPLADFVIARFDCAASGKALSGLTLRLNLTDDAGLDPPQLLRRFDYDIAANDRRRKAGPTIDQILPAASLEIAVEPSLLPAFASLRIFESEELCQAGASPMLEAGLSAKNRLLDVTGKILPYLQNARVRIFDSSRPVTACAPIEVVASTGKGAPLLTVHPQMLRPPGPTSLLVLSPSDSLARAGWRAPIQGSIRDWARGLMQDRKAVPVDMIEIAENRRTQTIMSSEDFSWLPEQGSQNSLLGRLDRIRFNASVSRPLDDINLVESAFSKIEFDRVVLILDSGDERFDPRDMGSLYHWLINRRVAMRILSLGGCDDWNEWTKNLENKAECVALDPVSDRQGKEATIRESLDWLLRTKGEVQ